MSRSGTSTNGPLNGGAMALTGSVNDMKHKTSETLFAYWDRCAASGATPRRFEIEPAKICGHPAVTPSFSSASTPRRYAIRLAGTRVCEMFGVELRGTNFLDGWSPKDRTLAHAPALRARQTGRGRDHPYGSGTRGARIHAVRGAAAAALRHTRPDHRPSARRFLAASTRRIGSASCRLAAKRIIANELVWPAGAPTIRERARASVTSPCCCPSRQRASCAPSGASSVSSKAASGVTTPTRPDASAARLSRQRLASAGLGPYAS